MRAGEFVTLLGPSGCGKTTLLRMVAGLLAPTAGRMRWWGDDAVPADDAARRLAMVFQSPTLMPWARVAANVRLPLDLAHVPRAAADAAAREALAGVGLADVAERFPRELSGGMQMRVSIARALVTAPTLLLMDEPFGALDEFTRHRLDTDLAALWHARGLTVLFVTHSIQEAVYLSTRVIVMAARPGRVLADVPVDEPHPRGPRFRGSAAVRRALRHAVDDRRARVGRGRAMSERLLRVGAPVAVAVVLLALWQAVVTWNDVPAYLVPSPARIGETLWTDRVLLLDSLGVTVGIALTALAVAVVAGVAIALLFAQSRLVEASLFPYAILLQVTPIVAIAPLIIIWVEDTRVALVLCAVVVAIFPIISNTTLGLRSVDPGLADLFRMSRASRWQTMLRLRIPSALP